MSSEIEGADNKTGCGETIDNRGVSPGVLADAMHQRDDSTRFLRRCPASAQKRDAFGTMKREFCEWRSTHLSLRVWRFLFFRLPLFSSIAVTTHLSAVR